MGLFVAFGLLTQIFEPGGKVLVDKLTRADGVIAIANNQVGQSSIEFDGLRNLS